MPPSFVVPFFPQLRLYSKGKHWNQTELKSSTRRRGAVLTAASQTPSVGNNASKISTKSDAKHLRGRNDEECPVYCYVACSPTKSDYLERVLTSRVYDVVDETSVEVAKLLSDRIGHRVWLKREDTTPVRSFKARGAYNMMAKSDPKLISRGVVAASAGNHAQGVALAAKMLGIPATIVMPAVTPTIKVDAVRKLGAESVLHGDNFDAAKSLALELSAAEGKLFIPPFDHPDVIAGQGTVGLELVRQLRKMDVIFVPVGGGGLIAGVATVLKRLRPEVQIIGVEPEDACAMRDSLRKGARVKLESVGTFADGVAVVEVGEETFRLCRDLVDGMVVVSNDEICAAIKDMFEDTRSILEPSGALAVAGLKSWAKDEKRKDLDLVAITSGANTNFDLLRHISERAELGEGREGVFAVTIEEKPGSFRGLMQALGDKVNITEFNYRYSCKTEAHVFVGAKIRKQAEATEIVDRVKKVGLRAIDLSNDEMAKLHIRHLVGGTAAGDVKNEVVYRFEFPERPGALKKFLMELPHGFNITLFHYRNLGGDVGRVLVGLTREQVVCQDEEQRVLQAFVDRLGYKYVREDDNVAYKLFLSKS